MQRYRRLVVLLSLAIAAVFTAPLSTSAFVPAALSTGDGTWVWQNPLPQGNALRAGYSYDGADIVALGEGGTRLHSTNGGTSWSGGAVSGMGIPVGVGLPGGLGGFAASLPDDSSSATWRTEDGGTTWTLSKAFPDVKLSQLLPFDGSEAVAVGTDWDSSNGILVRTSNGGSTWTSQTVLPEGQLSCIGFNGYTEGFVGGYRWSDGDESSVLLRTVDGSTWTTKLVTFAADDPSENQGHGIDAICAFSGGLTAVVAEDGNVYRTTDGGSTFTTSSIDGHVVDMAFANDDTNGWLLARGMFGDSVLHTADGGQTWTGQSFPAEVDGKQFHDLSVVGAGTVFAFGEGGVVVKTVNGGADWTRVGFGSLYALRSVSFGDASNGWAVGEDRNDPAILHTANGGLTWASQDTTVNGHFFGVCAASDQEAWAVGRYGRIVHTIDGGTTWEAQPAPVSTGFYGIDIVGSTGHGWVVGYDGTILHTANGGGTWDDQSRAGAPDLRGLSAVDTQTCIAVGESGAIVVTGDGGSTWTTRSAGFSGDTYFGVQFLDAEHGWVVGKQGWWGGVLLRTDDGGRRWSRATYAVEGFSAVSFFDASHGRAVSSDGNVLYTSDGGDTWSMERSGAAGGLRGIASMDATHTWTVGDSGEILFANGPAASSSTTVAGPPPLPPLPEALTAVAIEGGTRFETAVKASQQAFADGSASTVVLATGRNWPDALGGAALAKAVGGPILLCDTGSIPSVVTAEIARLGATKVYILGSDRAVSNAVVTALQDSGKTVTRIGGATRYETANMVAAKAIELLGAAYDGTAFAATGQNFPDALAASPLAAANGWPIYLFNPAVSPAGTIAAMNSAGVSKVRILGSDLVVPDATETSLRTAFGSGNVLRLEGPNRYATAAAIASDGVAEAGLGWNGVGIATGTNFPDALAGGVMLGKAGSVMLLTPGTALAPATEQALSAHKADIDTVYFLGGPLAVSQPVRDAVADALD